MSAVTVVVVEIHFKDGHALDASPHVGKAASDSIIRAAVLSRKTTTLHVSRLVSLSHDTAFTKSFAVFRP